MSVCRLCVCLLANTSGISLPYALRAHRSARAHLAEGVADGVHVRRRAPALRDEALVRHVVVELATHTHARQLQVQGQVQLSSAHTRQARLQGSGAARALASTWTNELGSRVRPQPEGWGPEQPSRAARAASTRRPCSRSETERGARRKGKGRKDAKEGQGGRTRRKEGEGRRESALCQQSKTTGDMLRLVSWPLSHNVHLLSSPQPSRPHPSQPQHNLLLNCIALTSSSFPRR
eukprot:1684903-Rhodomonas_salina.3